MRKKLILIAVGVVIIALLLTGLLLAKRFASDNPKPDNGSDTGTDVSEKYNRDGVEIYSVSFAMVDYFTVTNSYGIYDVRKSADGTVSLSGIENVNLLAETTANLYSSINSIVCESIVEMSAKDISVYGLDKPQATATIYTINGHIDTLAVGNKTPDGGAYYFRNEADSNVYAVSTYFAERLLKAKEDFVSKVLYKIYNIADLQIFSVDYAGGEKSDIYARLCTQAELDSKLYESSMILDKPFLYGANTDAVQDFSESLIGLTAESLVCVSASPEKLAEYGLDRPVKVTVGFNVDTSQATINNITNYYYNPNATETAYIQLKSVYAVGKTVDGQTYVMYDGTDAVYLVKSSYFEFTSSSIDTFCQRLVIIRYLNALKSVKIETSEFSYDINVWTKTNEDETVDYFASYKNRNLEGEYMQNLYKLIVGVSNYGYTESSAEGEAMLTITLSGMDNTVTKVEFIPVNDAELYAFCKINGSGHFIVKTSQLERIITNATKLVNGEKVEYYYQ